jgi:diguanylate cyclase (GGDEF)-like protein
MLTRPATRLAHALRLMVKRRSAVALVTLAIVTLPALITVDLRQAGEDGLQAESHLASYFARMRAQEGIEGRLVDRVISSKEADAQLQVIRDLAEEDLRESVERGFAVRTAREVTELTDQYTQAVDGVVRLIGRGQVTEALVHDGVRADPALARLNTFLEHETRQLAAEAQTAQRDSNRGVLLTVVLLSFLLGGLVQTARKGMQRSSRTMLQSEARYRALIDRSADLVAVLDRDGRATLVSPSVERLLAPCEPVSSAAKATAARAPAESVAFDFMCVVDPLDRERLLAALRTPAAGTLSAGEFRLNRKDGTGTYEVFVQDLTADPSVSGLVLTAHDVTDRLVLQREMEHLAMHDMLTGLPNRALLADRFEQALRAADRSGDSAGLLLLDLDRFKEVNDTFGHHYGDELLRQIGPRLTAVLRSVDTIARLGGDEFAVLLQDVPDVQNAIQVAHALLAALSTPFHVEGVDLDVEASIGVVISGEHGQDPVTLMQHADIAMYIAKRQHLGVFAYDPSVDGHSATKLAMIGDLRRGLQRGELVLYYQPKVNISTGDLVGAEALVRWQHPEHGLVFPDDFIPLAERTGLINPLTRHIMDTALAQARVWLDAGRPLPIAVNLSARNLHNERFAAQVDELLSVHDVPPHLLELEVTESAIMIDPVRACQMMEKLVDLGIRLSLDDFGAGYTSLSQLKALPISEIKIDRSFVKTMNEDLRDSLIVQSVIALGHNLGLTLVAEGVETEDALNTLASFGCDVFQGYHMTAPIPVAAFDAWIAGRRITPMPAHHPHVPVVDLALVPGFKAVPGISAVPDVPALPAFLAIQGTPGSLPDPHPVPLPEVVTSRGLSFLGGLARQQNSKGDHAVFLFDDGQELLHEVVGYVSDGLNYDGHALVIATAEQRGALRAALPQLRLRRAENEGRFLDLDAEGLLTRFMVGGLPDPGLFDRSVGGTVRDHQTGTGVLSVFCGLGAAIIKEGNLIGALRLEELWNELQLSTTFSLFCGHPLADVQDQPGDALAQIYNLHTHVQMSRSLGQDVRTDISATSG